MATSGRFCSLLVGISEESLSAKAFDELTERARFVSAGRIDALTVLEGYRMLPDEVRHFPK